MQQSLGVLIGVIFGTVFVFANADDPLPRWSVIILRIAAVVVLLAVLFLLYSGRNTPDTNDDSTPRPPMFGRWYWITLAAEAVAIPLGAIGLRAIDAPQTSTIAWVALVVGAHFVPLAVLWRQRYLLVTAALLTLLGGVGFIVSWTSATAWTPTISGVGSGVVFLAGCLAGMLTTRSAVPSTT